MHRLRVSESAFSLMVDAIHQASLLTKKFCSLAYVVGLGRDNLIRGGRMPPKTKEVLSSCAGDIIVFIRFNADDASELDAIRTNLAAEIGLECTMREVVCFCCLISLCKPD